MNKYNKYFYAGFALWLLETAYFGFNATAQSGAERVFDMVSAAFMAFGMIGSIAQGAAKDWLSDKVVKGETVTVSTTTTLEEPTNNA